MPSSSAGEPHLFPLKLPSWLWLPPPMPLRRNWVCPALLLILAAIVLVAFASMILAHLPDSLALKPR